MTKNYRLGKSFWRTIEEGTEREWMLGNGIGGFSNCSVIGNLSRIQSALLVASLNPPIDRISILTNVKESITIKDKTYDLSCQTYKDGNTDGYMYLESFKFDVLPEYSYQIFNIRVKKSICLEYGKNTLIIKYDFINGKDEASFDIVPVFGCRDNNEAVQTVDEVDLEYNIEKDTINVINNNDKRYIAKLRISEGIFEKRDEEDVYETKRTYLMDLKNGYTYPDIGYMPVNIKISLKPNEHKTIYIKCTIDDIDDIDAEAVIAKARKRAEDIIDKLSYHDEFTEKLALSADNFIVNRKSTGLKTIIAGFPWFADWGRDTMIALQGLTLCTGRFSDTRDILESFALNVNNGLIPNLFASYEGEKTQYNTVDASLWYFYSVKKYLDYTGTKEDYLFVKEKIYDVLKQIIEAYYNGTDYSIKMQDDSLISAGSGYDQVTWMDVRVDEWVVTPRHGKPVEINALWYNALKVMEELATKFDDDKSEWYGELSKKVKKSFSTKFWNEDTQCLYDVVDDYDAKIRPNQIWAISLPYTMLDRDHERKIVDTVYSHLYTCYGMRTLSYTDPGFKEKYVGDLSERDAAYHMGTTWPFILGGFITAYCKVNDYSDEAVKRAEEMCVTCFDHLNDGCLNGISEVFDGMNACTGNGCFNQAWSVGEMLRAYTEDVLMHR